MDKLHEPNLLRVLFLGNTCNNNFSFLRYLSDVGIDCTLALYSNEGYPSSNPIHNPEWDTFDISKYSHKIIRLPIPNSIVSVIGNPILLKLPPRLDRLKKLVDSYDIVIGSGVTPSLFHRMRKQLDIFYPYSTGIEWVEENENLKKLSKAGPGKYLRRYVYNTQVSGIRSAKQVVLGGLGLNAEVLDRYEIPYKVLFVPQYYPELHRVDVVHSEHNNYPSQTILDSIKKSKSFKIFAFARQLWVCNQERNDIHTWKQLNKRNNLLIRGLKIFLDSHPRADVSLFLSEWGPDVDASRKLVHELGIESCVVWLPVMPRRLLSYILQHFADIGVGEFVQSPDMLWGSTGWECLSLGIPYMETVNFTNTRFDQLYGFSLPPMIYHVNTANDVATSIHDVFTTKDSKSPSKFSQNTVWHSSFIRKHTVEEWVKLFSILKSKKNC